MKKMPKNRRSGGKLVSSRSLNVPLTPERETLVEFDVFDYNFFVFQG